MSEAIEGRYKCPFRGTLMTGQFGCEQSEQITRREGPDIGCRKEQANDRCIQLFNRLKQQTLPVFEVEDDLSVMPASILQKIQFGGLNALTKALSLQAAGDRIENIYSLISMAESHYGSIADIPCELYVQDIVNYKLKRRRDR